ncbi:MAG: aminotransferase class IV [Saprospirales bacterium]|nr:aminotransferase class IV [Saprospirales bacterium]
MIRFHAINGRLTDAAQASLHVNDLAILRGYGIFDFFLVKTGRPLFIEDYLDRFFNSAHLMELDLPVSRTGLHEKILEVIEANKLTEGAIRLLLTGGYAEDSFTPQSPNWLVLAHDLKPHKQELFTAGGKLLLQQFQREFPMAKTINYGNALRMRKKSRKRMPMKRSTTMGGRFWNLSAPIFSSCSTGLCWQPLRRAFCWVLPANTSWRWVVH